MFNKAVIKIFLELVKIDSPSGQEAGVADFIIKYLKKNKLKAVKDDFGNVILRIRGEGKPLLLSSHLDTVEPGRRVEPVVRGKIIKSNGKTILGADAKAGVAALLEAAIYLNKRKQSHRPLEIIFTREEELGLRGAAALDFKKIQAQEALVIDYGRPLGYISLSAPFIYHLDLKIIGRSAHAGAEPEKGLSAIQVAAKAIAEMKLGRINKQTTCNIGLIKGGSAINCVPEKVSFQAEASGQDLASAQEQVDLINRACKKQVRRYGAKLIFKSKLECRGYRYPGNDKFIKKIADTFRRRGIKPILSFSGGATDANVFVSRGIKAVNVSYGGGNMHTKREFIKTTELADLVCFIIELVRAK